MMVKVFSTNFIIKRFYSGVTNKIRAQKYVLTKYFVGEPKKNDFEIIEEELPELKDGEILTEAEYLSVDPYMRAYMIGYKLPAEMIGGQVAKVIESRNKDIPVGSYVTGMFGWCTHKIINPSIVNPASMLPLTVVPDIKPHPVSLALGILGMPGNTAYFGLKEICTPKPGETIVITGAAGAVGSHVGQIGKILGCRVIGFAGTDEKCHYLEKELGFDHAYNYKTCKIRDALKQGAPNRVDCYFDNEVWNKLLEIPYGSTQTYGSLAKEMGRPASHSRAVGAACGANPLLLVIPCHRLVASGSKGGFSCGMDRKEWLISHENKSSEI